MRTLRSMLFVPGDSERKLARGASSGADALILDLEDSVVPERRSTGRAMVRDYLVARTDHARCETWVRINPLSGPDALTDLVEIVGGAPHGVVVPKVDSPAELVRLDHFLQALERREGLAVGTVGILPVATETPRAVLSIGTLGGSTGRLRGLTWGAEDLAAAIGAATNRDEAGGWDFTAKMARSLCLLAAHAARVQAIDTLTGDFRDEPRLRREVREARRMGFTGKLAIHPDQVGCINDGFSPDEAELVHARAVVAAFDAAPGAGAVQLDGNMLDRPHLVQAMRVLAMAVRASDGETLAGAPPD